MNSPSSLCSLRGLVRFGLAAVLLWAGVAKIAHPADFFSDLIAYDLPLPDLLLRIVAISLPWFEALCGAALLFDIWTETVRPVVAGLCLIFVLMLAQAVVRGLDLNCGCFGRTEAGWAARLDVALARAIILLAASIHLLRRPA